MNDLEKCLQNQVDAARRILEKTVENIYPTKVSLIKEVQDFLMKASVDFLPPPKREFAAGDTVRFKYNDAPHEYTVEFVEPTGQGIWIKSQNGTVGRQMAENFTLVDQKQTELKLS